MGTRQLLLDSLRPFICSVPKSHKIKVIFYFMRSRVCKCNPPFGFGGGGWHSLGGKVWGRVPIRTRGQTHRCGTLGTVNTRMYFRGKIYRVRSSKFNCLHAHSCTKSRIASTPRILSIFLSYSISVIYEGAIVQPK